MSSQLRSNINHEESRLEDKLDKMLGYYYWRTYWATSLWANLSTPINLSITIFTALMTAHSSSSSSFIGDDLNMKINIATFFISIINTFFAPQKQFNELNEYLCKWSDLGNTFEKVIFSNKTKEEKIKDYSSILDKANDLFKDQISKKRNFFTDFLHIIVRTIFMQSNDRWMKQGTFEFYEKIQDAGIELDFELKSLKYETKNASTFERVCACFKCFNCYGNPEPSQEIPQASPKGNSQINAQYKDTSFRESPTKYNADIELQNIPNPLVSSELKPDEKI
jgi:hypothetical protein